jgi:hypothetical protein
MLSKSNTLDYQIKMNNGIFTKKEKKIIGGSDFIFQPSEEAHFQMITS